MKMPMWYKGEDGSLATYPATSWPKKDCDEAGLSNLWGPSLDVASAMEALFEDPKFYGGAFAALVKASANKLGDEATIRRTLLALTNSFEPELIDKVMTDIGFRDLVDGPKEVNG